jgi:hypothetical protein
METGFCLVCAVLLLFRDSLVASATAEPMTRTEAAGWLTLERDQRVYREQVAPLNLRERRRLDAIERGERNALRALQQREERARAAEQRRLRQRRREASALEGAAVGTAAVPRRSGRAARRQQRLERAQRRLRLDLRRDRQRRSFGTR